MSWAVANELACLVLLCAVLFLAVRPAAAPLRLLVSIQLVFWLLGYGVRAWVLTTYHPQPLKDDPVADPRIAASGYVPGVVRDLTVVNVSVAAWCAVVLAYLLVTSGRPARVAPTPRVLFAPFAQSELVFLYSLGWIGRLGLLLRPASAAVGLVGLMASISAFMLVATVRRGRLRTPAVIVALEAVWSVLFSSKTPVLAVLCALLLGAMAAGARRSRGLIAAAGAAGFVAFLGIQRVKTLEGHQVSNLSSYSGWLRPFMPIVTRFDLLSSVTDATTAGRGAWLTSAGLVRLAVLALVPRPLDPDKEAPVGALWALDVRGLTVSTGRTSVTSVHLAHGPAAEGFVVAGYPGVVVESVVLALLTIGCAVALVSRSRWVLVLAAYVAGLSALSEGAVVNVAEALGKGIEATVLVMLALAVRSVARARIEGRGPAPGPAPGPCRAGVAAGG